LSYVDLDIDVLVAPDLTYKILDEEDFEANAVRYSYPDDVQANARLALAELIELIEARAFPFNE
jgi:protein associated with RNAse G/E